MLFNLNDEDITPEKIAAVTAALSEPFAEEDLYYKPQVVKRDKTKCMIATYADPRAYIDRINEVVGSSWGTSYYFQMVDPILGGKGEKWGYELAFKGKIIVTCDVKIHGIGEHADIGEAWLDDENAATAASAQAFKRALTQFGVGRYLYDLPKNVWCDYDEVTKKPKNVPPLPDWALPKKKCSNCSLTIVPYIHGTSTIPINSIIANGINKYGKTLCADCQKKLADKK